MIRGVVVNLYPGQEATSLLIAPEGWLINLAEIEAAEDREILVARIARIARLVQRTLARPAEHPPIRWDDEEPGFDDGTDGSESLWDASYKENRRRQERMHRAIEEHLARGDDIQQAFDRPLRAASARIIRSSNAPRT